MIAQGVHAKQIMELLGHSSITLTMDVYRHLIEQVEQETADKMDEILGKAKPDPAPEPVAVKNAVKTKLFRVK